MLRPSMFAGAIAVVLTLVIGSTLPAADEPKSILMIGNSLIYTWDIPSVLRAMAAERKKTVDIVVHTTGGKGIVWHWSNQSKPSNQTAPEAIKSRNWDLIVLEQAGPPLKEQPEYIKTLKDYVDLIRTTNKQTRVVLYMPWPYGGTVDAASTKGLWDFYLGQADTLGISCSPIAKAFFHCEEQNPKLALIDSQKDRTYAQDQVHSHQSPFGTYVAACTLFASFYDENPIGLTVRTAGKEQIRFADADALLAQQVAWTSWGEYKAASTLFSGKGK